MALKLGEFAFRRGSIAVGSGWITRTERLLENEAVGPTHGWLAVERSILAMMVEGDIQVGEVEARKALEIARQFGDSELEAMALSAAGTALVRKGEWVEGMAMIDEAAAAAGSGELAPKTACDVYCITISTCCEASDYRRAAEWTEQVDRWMERHSIRGYRGECRLHRAELKRRQGAWAEAEQEARDACRELEDFRLLDSVALAHYEIGEVRLRMGDLEGAEASFAAAYEMGRDPHPGLALVMLARGDPEGAAAAMQRVLNAGAVASDGVHVSGDLLIRAMVLPAASEVALAAGDVEGAAASADELSRIAATYESVTIEAAARLAQGAVALARGEIEGAVSHLEQSWRLWRRSDSPYEAARARLLLGQARQRAGDESTGRIDLAAARAEFGRLGAQLDLRTVDELLGPADVPDRVEKTFLFTDIASSTEIVDAIGDDAWQDLLGWHDRVLREVFVRHRGEVVKHTGDGFFAVFDRPSDAVEGAVAIQHRLAEHRRQHGFAPRVRIGIHASEATRTGDDYSGHAVHVTSRVAGLAAGGQILVSSVVAAAASSMDVELGDGERRQLKGVREPVVVHEVHWGH